MSVHASPHEDNPQLMADRVNIEPPIFRGCSSSELLQLVSFLTVVGLPLAVAIAVALGKPMLFLGIIMVFDVGGVWAGAGWFQRVKRGRPDHYYVHLARAWAAAKGLIRSAIIRRSGAWDLYATRRGARP
jgi:conjugative transfer region protein (TIGR03750 family)